MAISTALHTVVDTIIFVISAIVFCIIPLSFASELVRYIISDYKAVVAVVSVDIRAAVAFGLVALLIYLGILLLLQEVLRLW